MKRLCSKAVKGAARALEGIHNIECSDSFPNESSQCANQHFLHSEIYLLACSVYVTESRITCGVSADASAAVARTTHVLKENLQDATSLLIDEARDTLDTSTTSKTTNSLPDIRQMVIAHIVRSYRFCDTLDVVTQNLAVALGTTPTPRSVLLDKNSS